MPRAEGPGHGRQQLFAKEGPWDVKLFRMLNFGQTGGVRALEEHGL
jgi:hypothetical protein